MSAPDHAPCSSKRFFLHRRGRPHVETGGHIALDLVRESAELLRACRSMHLPTTVPIFTSRAAKSEVVPCRL